MVAEQVLARRPPPSARWCASCSADALVRWPVAALTRALANLVTNGLQASPQLTPVALSFTTRGGHTIVTVVDRGRGMTAEELARAGEPFFMTKPPGVGTGLGLFVARTAVEQLGGTVTIESAAARGTTVTDRLPSDALHSPSSDDDLAATSAPG